MSANPVGDFISGAEHAISTEAAQLLHTAQQQTALFGSFVNGHITGPLAAKFGSNPVQFINNAIRSDISTYVLLINRTAQAAHVTTYRVPDPKTGKLVDVKATCTTKTPFPMIALLAALAALNHPGEWIDEGGRIANGIGPRGHGIDGHAPPLHFWPMHGMRGGVGQAHGFVEGVPLPTPTDLAALAAIATIIAAIASVAIPVLASAVGFVTNLVAPKPPPPPKDASILGISPVIILAVAAAGIALVLLLLKHKPAAGGAA